MKVEITFTEPLLGTLAGNKEIAEEFIGGKHPKGTNPEELRAMEKLEEAIGKQSTGFARNGECNPILWDYQIKGFFKEACDTMINTGTLKTEELKKVRLTQYLHKRTIDKMIFVTPRQIPLTLPVINKDGEPDELTFCERPLRGQTMKGERISLARSEQAPVGTKIYIEIITLNKNLEPFIERWLDYMALFGLGQWRTSGKGRATWRKSE